MAVSAGAETGVPTAVRDALCGAALAIVWIAAPVGGTSARAEPWIAAHEFSGNVSLENRWYPEAGAHPDQRAHASGFVAAPQLYLEDAEGRSVTLAPFLRYDAGDPDRTHADLREAYMLLVGEIGDGEWELRAGIDRVFWGVAESRHLVDIVNQTDLVEHPNEEAKLGQPMVHVTWSGDWGAAELFGLPYHRARTFPGRRGRLRGPLVVDNDRATYESGAGEWHFDFAARYSHGFGPLDLGLSLFDGTSREPALIPVAVPGSGPVLIPHYARIRQLGLDAQVTTGAWLLKLEAIGRTGARDRIGRKQDYAAVVAGFEYTLYSILGFTADLGLLGEWNRDGRGRDATNQFQNDLFLGARLALNDVQGTEFLAGVLADADHGTDTLTVEFDRRLSDRWSLHLEAVALFGVGEADIAYPTRRDSFMALNLDYSF